VIKGSTALPAAAVADPSVDLYLARQPIFDRQDSVLGYELLFRSGLDNFFKPQDASRPSECHIDNFLLFGLETLTCGRRAFINFTRNDLIRDLPTLFPRDRIVVEILESALADAEAISACRRLKQAGYLIALDDFVLSPRSEPFLPFADVIKVDFRTTREHERERLARYLAPRGIKLLAEKVETHEDILAAREIGYTYFQGYFYCKPQIVSTSGLSGFKPNYLRILQAVNQTEMNLREIEDILKQEPSLLYKLLRYLNSAYFGLRAEITSIRHALALLGEEKLRKWTSVAAMVHLAHDKPSELIITSLVRARFCESLAVPLGMAVKETDLFLLGLMSTMDAVLGRHMSQVVREVPLSEEVAAALLNEQSSFCDVLTIVLALEQGAWHHVSRPIARLRLDEAVIPGVYLRAIDWTTRIFQNASGK
jgi:EAL and modified HD-GYP domain-containing signal transduction protein